MGGREPNSINLRSKGVIPVAILGHDGFDVTYVDVNTLKFGPNGVSPAHDLTDPSVYAGHLKGVNGDGDVDLVSHYVTQETGLVKGDKKACLEFEIDGVLLTLCDSIKLVGK